MTIEGRIADRQKVRARIAKKRRRYTALLLISNSIDDYIEYRIKADKVFEGILKDIRGDVASMAELNRKILTQD